MVTRVASMYSKNQLVTDFYVEAILNFSCLTYNYHNVSNDLRPRPSDSYLP